MAGAFAYDFPAIFAIFEKCNVPMSPAYVKYIKKLEEMALEKMNKEVKSDVQRDKHTGIRQRQGL